MHLVGFIICKDQPCSWGYLMYILGSHVENASPGIIIFKQLEV